jgi:hypothetical protein
MEWNEAMTRVEQGEWKEEGWKKSCGCDSTDDEDESVHEQHVMSIWIASRRPWLHDRTASQRRGWLSLGRWLREKRETRETQ